MIGGRAITLCMRYNTLLRLRIMPTQRQNKNSSAVAVALLMLLNVLVGPAYDKEPPVSLQAEARDAGVVVFV